MIQKISLLLVAFFCVLILNAQKSKQFTPGEIWNDNTGTHINAHGGGILFHKGTYYWYGEHKIAGKIGNTAQVGVGCYSSKDLYNWKNEGIALKVDETNPASDITKGCILERPKVIYNAKTRKFVMWFHLELKDKGYDAARSGVAVSDHPTGPFTFLKSFRPNAGFWPVNVQPFHKKPVADWVKSHYCGGKGCLPAHVDSVNILGRDFKGGQMARDMNLFVDDDGTAYHIYSSEENSTTHISKLTDDYLSYSGQYFRVFPGRYMEGGALFKRNGKYYFIASDCTGWEPNAARSAVADEIFGEWKELGNPAIGKDSELTFHSQSTFVLKVQGKKDSYIYLGDRWTPDNPIDGRYIWLPIKFENDEPKLYWQNQWSL
jgi:beta-xylosidase